MHVVTCRPTFNFTTNLNRYPILTRHCQVDLHCVLHRVATSSCRGHVDELATEPFLLLHREHGTGYRRSWNCCDRRTCFIVIWKHFCFILSTDTMIRIDSVMRPRSSSRGRKRPYKCLSYNYSYCTALLRCRSVLPFSVENIALSPCRKGTSKARQTFFICVFYLHVYTTVELSSQLSTCIVNYRMSGN